MSTILALNWTNETTLPSDIPDILPNKLENTIRYAVPSYVGICALIASLISLHHIYCHLKNFMCPSEQKNIVRIVLLVPAYAVYSFMSCYIALEFQSFINVYIEPVHDIAEAISIYSFLALCYEYLGGEASIMLQLAGRTIKRSIYYGTCCFSGRPYTVSFIRFCKVATMQYVFLKPLTSVLAIVLSLTNKYTPGDFSPASGYLYILLINNLIVTLALYGLVLFYFATQEQLRPFSPVLKFATIKAIIFLSFWQHVLFRILQWSNVIQPIGRYAFEELSTVYLSILVITELLITSVILRYAFPYSIYAIYHAPRLVLDIPTGDSGWSGLGRDSLSGSDVRQNGSSRSTNPMKTLKADLLFGSAQYSPNLRPEPLPWERFELDDDNKLDDRKPTVLPSIATSLKATIDPRDIFVDAIHNFHPTYRHYAQTRSDGSI